MTDKVSPKRRSEIMSNIHNKDTSIELKVRKKLFSLGYRYRVNYKKLPGKPDIVFTKKKIVIFIHGCFWHGHDINCRYTHTPKSRTEYWNNKISKTKLRDKKHIIDLENSGWKVLVIWECEIQTDFDNVINKIIDVVNSA